MIYVNFGDIRDHLKQNLALQFCGNRNKDISILTETHINLDQIQHIGNSLLDAIFFSSGDIVTQKDCLPCFIWVLKGSLRLTLIQKGGLCPLKLLILMTKFSVFMPLQGTAPRDSWPGAVSLKDYKIISNIKMKEMKTK